QWAHAIAPKANLLVVEAQSDSISDLIAAVDYARHQAGVTAVSMSWGLPEDFVDASVPARFDSYFTTPAGHTGVTFVAASGDDSAFYGPSWPAEAPTVVGVGGTSLRVRNSNGTYSGERVWQGSGGGLAFLESQPAYQSKVQNTGYRTSPDISYNADPNNGF